MTRKEEIERRLLFAIDTNEERDKAVDSLDIFIQEEVEPLREALGEIRTIINSPYDGETTCSDSILKLIEQTLKGKKPDPSRAELMRIENWVIFGQTICGNIYNDERSKWKDGTEIRTSTVQNMRDDFKEGDTVKTKNSIYILGKTMYREIGG